MVFVLKPLAILAATVTLVTGACVTPKQRKEWRQLTTLQRKQWLDAVKCFSFLPHDPSLVPTVNPSDIPPVNPAGSYYDDFVYIHMDLNRRIHNTGQFFPWHRWYVHKFESILKNRCGYTGTTPYWDWSLDASNFQNSPFFGDSNTQSGLGGWGNPANDYQVTTGALAGFHLSYPIPHNLRRNFTDLPWTTFPVSPSIPNPFRTATSTFTASEVSAAVNGFVGDFSGLQNFVEGRQGSHGGVHQVMGGDLGGKCPLGSYAGCTPGATWSSNEPLFFMHHAMIDKIWYDWQHKNAANGNTFTGGSVQDASSPTGIAPMLTTSSLMPTDGLFPASQISTVMDTQAGDLCYVYV